MSCKSRSRWRAPLLVLVTGLIGSIGIAAQPMPGRAVAAVFPPWWGLPRIAGAVAAADGDILRSGAWPSVIIAYSPAPAFAARLRRAGAWLLLDPLGLGPCGKPVRQQS